jgi:hypothetical protein
MTPSTGRIYYVDDTLGNDSNPGTIEAPWKSITKVNGVSLVAGEQVLFKRGETFAGKLTPSDSGSTGHPIIYGAYGIGNRPIINGTADSALFINACNYLRIEYIDFAGSSVAGGHTSRCYDSHDQYFYDCIFRDAAGTAHGSGYGIAIGDDPTGVLIYNITLDTCQAYNNRGCGIALTSDLGTYGPHDCLIYQCVTHNNGQNWAYGDHGIYIRHGVVIDGCISYDNPIGSGIKVNDQGVMDGPFKPIVRNCIVYSNHDGITLDNNHSLIYNNLSYGNTYSAIVISLSSLDSEIYFNTFANNIAGNGLIEFDVSAGLAVGVILKNNLFIQDHAVYDKTIIWGTTLSDIVANNTFDYNIYFHNVFGDPHGVGIDGGGYHTWADWQGYGAEPNGIMLYLDPDFVTRYTDWHPANAGNLDGHDGVAITGYELDKDGNTRADPPNCGCYEEASA